MPAETELEIKLAVTDQRLWSQLLSDPELQAMQDGQELRTRSFEAFYFDTADFILQASGIAYRIRHEGDAWVATVKSDNGSGGALFSREELNETVAGPNPAIHYFAGTRLGERLTALLGDTSLQLLFSTKFERTTMLLKTMNSSHIELALDHGMIWSGSDGLPISEVELELKTGSASDLLQLAGWLAEKYHLHPEPLSKYARGLSLLQIAAEEQQKPLFTPLPERLVGNCISEIFKAQSGVVRGRGAPESIKALRIQLRKLRSLLKFFAPLIELEGGEASREKLKIWGDLLGSIRDLDVLQDAWRDFAENCGVPGESAGNWRSSITGRREFLAETVIYRLERAELTRIMFELQAWLLQKAGGLEKKPFLSERRFRKNIMEQVQELREQVGAISGIPEIKQLHVLRIKTKRLRYLLETVSELPGYRDDHYMDMMKKMQNLIGKIHDIYQIKTMLEKFQTDEGEPIVTLQPVQLFIGWRSREVLRTFFALPQALETFRRAGKDYLRTLAALRHGDCAKVSHDTDTHEPVQ